MVRATFWNPRIEIPNYAPAIKNKTEVQSTTCDQKSTDESYENISNHNNTQNLVGSASKNKKRKHGDCNSGESKIQVDNQVKKKNEKKAIDEPNHECSSSKVKKSILQSHEAVEETVAKMTLLLYILY